MVAIHLNGRSIGPPAPCFVIAEAGVNHNGDRELALRLIDAAIAAGADAVKFQTFKADKLATRDAPKAEYQATATGTEESQHEMLLRLELSTEDHVTLRDYCRNQGILFLSTPFDEDSADLLEWLGVPLIKIGSGDLTNLPLLAHVARKKLPMIVSTGMSTLGEVESAVNTIEQNGNPPLVLLHCVTNYPAEAADVNLRAMQTMGSAFNYPVGYSDHTQGVEVSLAAVALGACVIEKHFTLDRTLPGPDHAASLEPPELLALTRGIRVVEAALGGGRKQPAPSEVEMTTVVRRSLVAARDIPEGTMVTNQLLASKRTGGLGIPPNLLGHVLGRTTSVAIPAGTPLDFGMLS